MWKRLKQILCRHEWRKVSDKMVVKDKHYILMRTKCKCIKCGKVGYF